MYLISHRGNITGRQPERENAPDYILEAIEAGYYCEVDVFGKVDGSLWLGHDGPQYKTDTKFLNHPKILVHCKNKLAIDNLNGWGIHWFWHQSDDYTITTQGWVWAYPNKPCAGHNCIAVMPALHLDVSEYAGVCSDYIGQYK
tara:strand:+ start:155 stop:583 length:429 start_codon:yes stop_codon:yes gene_type:complete